jgi:serine/threonine-protein kinase
MSKKGDFLSGFSGGNTQKPLTEQNETPVIGDKPTEKSKTDVKKDTKKDIAAKTNVAENKKLADKIVADDEKKRNAPIGTATRPAQNASAIIKAPEHTVTKDEKFHKRKMFKYGIIGTSTIVAIVLIFFLVRILTSVEVSDFTGVEIKEVRDWGLFNSITINRTSEYSIEVPEGSVISQSHEPGSSLARNAVLSVVVSDGPDMNEVIKLPDFEEMTRAEIITWRNENGFTASSIAITDESSSDFEANEVLRVEIPNETDVNSFTRSSRLNIIVSSGPETVEMKNFMGRLKKYMKNS